MSDTPIVIVNPIKPWWPGDQRVEQFMHPVNEALNRAGLVGDKRTDVYNRAYEAVYNAIVKYAATPKLDEMEKK